VLGYTVRARQRWPGWRQAQSTVGVGATTETAYLLERR